MSDQQTQTIQFKAETQKLLDILIHSLYSDREIFLRELISNASDALTRMSFIMLTDREVLDPEAELAIKINIDKENKQIIIEDTGVGMSQEEVITNLGTIAHSGITDFIEATKDKNANISDLIGQFGVGFYSAFMVAESIEVETRSYKKAEEGVKWFSKGIETFSVEPLSKPNRGTRVILNLKTEYHEFLDVYRIKNIIHKHSEYIPFPIYVNDENEPTNQRIAIWRKNPREVTAQEYEDFYRQFTLDINKPIYHIHLSIDAPVQLYAILYIPSSPEKPLFTPRKEDGLKLYARKILIQEFTTDLLPPYFRFIQGVVDSEDIPLNVSRETIQANKIISQLKKILTGKIIDTLKDLDKNQPDLYQQFWVKFGSFLKEGIAVEPDYHPDLPSLLRFKSLNSPEMWISFDNYLEPKKENQKAIYYILGSDDKSVTQSPHLDYFRKHEYNVLLFTEPVDPFFLLRLEKYKDHKLVNVANETPQEESQPASNSDTIPATSEQNDNLITRFKKVLGERVAEIRISNRLYESPARLQNKDSTITPELQRVYQLLKKDYPAPEKILEINPTHPILQKILKYPQDDPINDLVIEQIYENTLLSEGLHPNPASMIPRIHALINKSLGD